MDWDLSPAHEHGVLKGVGPESGYLSIRVSSRAIMEVKTSFLHCFVAKMLILMNFFFLSFSSLYIIKFYCIHRDLCLREA